MSQQLAVSPLRLRQGAGIFVNGVRIAARPANYVGQGGGGNRAAPAPRQRQIRADQQPPHDCPYYCPFCPHCQKIKHLLNNGLPQLPLGVEAYYNRLRNQQAPAQGNPAQVPIVNGAPAQVPLVNIAPAQVPLVNIAPAQVNEAQQDQGQDGTEGGEEGRAEDMGAEEEQVLIPGFNVSAEEDEINVAGEEINVAEAEINVAEAVEEHIPGFNAPLDYIALEVVNDLVADLVADVEGNESGRLIPLNISENLHSPPSSFDIPDVDVPNNSRASMDRESEVVDTPLVINRVRDVTPPPPKRCHKDCRCCVPSCPCSKSPSNVPVLQARCICICHKKSRKSSSAAKRPRADGSGPSTSAEGNVASGGDVEYELPDARHLPQRDHQRRLQLNSDLGGSFAESELHNRTKKAKLDKSTKRKRGLEAEDEEQIKLNPKSFKRYAPEAVARSLGDTTFLNQPDGTKVPYALRCLGFKRSPDIVEENTSGPRRSRRLATKK